MLMLGRMLMLLLMLLLRLLLHLPFNCFSKELICSSICPLHCCIAVFPHVTFYPGSALLGVRRAKSVSARPEKVTPATPHGEAVLLETARPL